MTNPRFKPSRLLLRLRAELLKRLQREPQIDQLNRALAERELYFRAPDLDPELLEVVHRITPQFHLRLSEQSRRLWELSQNGSCWGEFEALAPVLEALPRPSRVLEIGPGLGRSVVFFKRKLGWERVPFHLYDADGDNRHYALMGARTPTSFCGNLAYLARVLEHNGVDTWEIHDAARLDYRLDGLPGPFDLIYSFYGVGFHWSIEHFWSEIESLMDEDSLAIFTVANGFEPPERLHELGYALVSFERILAKDRPLRLLLVSRNRRRLAFAERVSAVA